MRWMQTLLGVGLLGLSACGNSVGGPCTTSSDCPNQVCLNRDYTPGGYCSAQCTPGQDDTCPAGNSCIADGVGVGVAGCFKLCTNAKDCRSGYACRAGVKDNPKSICIGPTGI